MAASFDVAFKRSPIKTLHSAITTPTGVVEAQSVGFSFYSAAEVRKISVVQVHTAEQRDAHNRPLPGGLYDPAMGPTDQYESCKTCGLDYTTCPGHLGHIELRCRRTRRCSSRSSSRCCARRACCATGSRPTPASCASSPTRCASSTPASSSTPPS